MGDDGRDGGVAGERSRGALARARRAAVLVPMLVVACGVALEAVWRIRVAAVFESVALFGCLMLFEQDSWADRRWDDNGFQMGATLVTTLLLSVAILINVDVVRRISNEQADQIAATQLEVIGSELQDTIADAEQRLMRVAIEAEEMIEAGASKDDVSVRFDELYDEFRAIDTFMNVYVAGKDWYVLPHSQVSERFRPQERVWYVGALDAGGDVFVSEPYADANGNGMCLTTSVAIGGGETVCALDLNLGKVQESITEMTQGRDETAMIVTADGLVVGYTDMSLAGMRVEERLPAYTDIVRRVAASREHDSFVSEIDGTPHMVFSSETGNGWYLILSVDTSRLYGESTHQVAMLAAVNLIMVGVVAVYCVLSVRRCRQAREALIADRELIEGYTGDLAESAAHLIRLGDTRLLHEGDDVGSLAARVTDSGQHLQVLAHGLAVHAASLEALTAPRAAELPREHAAGLLRATSVRVRNAIVATLLLSLVVALVFCVRLSVTHGTTLMDREADSCEAKLDEWLARQRTTLSMFSDAISARPELMGDYDEAVAWLADVSANYPDVSLCYMANPYAEHPVIMSNGWEPGVEFRPETRPWYKDTERSPSGFSVSAPYLDAESGTYCVTLSQQVIGADGEFLGIFGIDLFLDKLIGVFGSTYSSDGYAFLVDSDGVIVNHPNPAYQMGSDSSTSVEDTEYADAYNASGVTSLVDATGHRMACVRRTSDAGFTIVVANRWWDVYFYTVLVAVVLVVLFGASIVFVVVALNRLIRWQEAANRELEAAVEAAESANQAKSRFLSSMSHEIRTPMNAIIGLDAIALRDETISEATRDDLEKIGASAKHLLSLINDILDMSRIESGRMQLKEEPFAFSDLLAQVEVIVGGQCREKGLAFVVEADGTAEACFVGDALKLKQVIINILGNSVKFTDAPGHITFTASHEETGEGRARLTLTMADTGIGMDKDFIPHLFDSFTMEDSANTSKYGGSGLGMAITKSIVEMMGGEIEVESEKGLGSTFVVTVTLGLASEEDLTWEGPADTVSRTPAGEPVSLEGRNILIAEDQEMNAEVLSDLLDLEDMTSEWAENGRVAVELFEQSEEGHFDAILMDMRMPVMDGLAATRAIRALDRADARAIPIIALTANAFEDDVRQCIEAGMDAHLAKPIDIDQVTFTLCELLRDA